MYPLTTFALDLCITIESLRSLHSILSCSFPYTFLTGTSKLQTTDRLLASHKERILHLCNTSNPSFVRKKYAHLHHQTDDENFRTEFLFNCAREPDNVTPDYCR